jgi:hypothetical protein
METEMPVGQPYFLVGVHEAIAAKAITANTVAIRRTDENTCIKMLSD